MSSGVGIFSPCGVYNPYGSGLIGQRFSYGDISLTYTSSSRAKVTDNGSDPAGDNMDKWSNLLVMQFGGSLSKEDLAALKNHDYGQVLTDIEVKPLGDDSAVTGRMSNWLKTNDFTELTDRDGQIMEFNGLTTHNGALYERRIRKEYATANSQYSPISDSRSLGKLELLDASTASQELQFHVMTDEESQAAEAKAYDMSHYSMEESFLMDLNEGRIGASLTSAVTAGDTLKSIESFSYEAARYGALLHDFYGSSENISELEDKLSSVIKTSIQTFAEKVANDVGSFFLENGVAFNKSAMTSTIQDITASRLSEYQASFQNSEISIEDTDASVYSYMTAQSGDTSTDNAQFGKLNYSDITRLSETVYEFSNSIMSQQNNVSASFNTTAEQAGMVLGLAQSQARILNDGSSLFSAFSKAANNNINTVIDSIASESLERSEKFKNSRGGINNQTCETITETDIRKVMGWFSGIEYGDTQSNLQLAMNKVYDSYMNTNKSDVKYVGANSKLFDYMPQAFFEDLAQERSDAITDIQSYLLVNWNIWANSSNAAANSSKYLVGDTINVQV